MKENRILEIMRELSTDPEFLTGVPSVSDALFCTTKRTLQKVRPLPPSPYVVRGWAWERAAVEILRKLHPDADIRTQVRVQYPLENPYLYGFVDLVAVEPSGHHFIYEIKSTNGHIRNLPDPHEWWVDATLEEVRAWDQRAVSDHYLAQLYLYANMYVQEYPFAEIIPALFIQFSNAIARIRIPDFPHVEITPDLYAPQSPRLDWECRYCQYRDVCPVLNPETDPELRKFANVPRWEVEI